MRPPKLKRGEWPTSVFQIPDNARAIHRLACRLGIRYEERQNLHQYGRVAYEVTMLSPEMPRRRYRRWEPDSLQWVEWHRVRGNDPYAYKATGYALPRRLRVAVIARDGLVCGICGGSVEVDDIHIDHIHPRCLGGTDDLSNLQVAHSFCNISKGARIVTRYGG